METCPLLPDFLSVCPGCVDGLVGVAARVAWAQTPWISVGEEPSPDLANHIAGLESMLLELQLRVRQDPSVRLSVCPPT